MYIPAIFLKEKEITGKVISKYRNVLILIERPTCWWKQYQVDICIIFNLMTFGTFLNIIRFVCIGLKKILTEIAANQIFFVAVHGKKDWWNKCLEVWKSRAQSSQKVRTGPQQTYGKSLRQITSRVWKRIGQHL